MAAGVRASDLSVQLRLYRDYDHMNKVYSKVEKNIYFETRTQTYTHIEIKWMQEITTELKFNKIKK